MRKDSLTRLFGVGVALGTLSGCASISKNECLSANWEDIGVRDGANGQPEEYLIQHSKACAKVQVTPNRAAWQRGRERGLARFCVPQRAYSAGEWGGSFDVGLCASHDPERLADAYSKGREVHRLAEVVSSLDSEIRDVRATLERKDLEQKERERLAYRLGQLEYERNDAARAHEDAVYRARDL